MFINQFFSLFNYHGLMDSIYFIIRSVNAFSIVLFPVAFIVSILVIFSNIILLKKEGFTWRNMLGIILGVLVIIATITPNIINNILQTSTFIDIHNQNGIALYIYEFLETFIFICVSYLECILLATIILGVKAAKNLPEFDKDFIIILGCKIRKDGTLTPLLKGRVDRAIEFFNRQKNATGKDIVFVPSGGQGSDEVISEAEAMKNYLIEKGINKKQILLEDKSTSTYQNIKFSYELIKKRNDNPNIVVSTTNYHVFRAGNIAYNQGIKVDGIGSSTKSYFWINAFIREFIATIYSEKKNHLSIIGLIMFFTFIMIIINYIGNIF